MDPTEDLTRRIADCLQLNLPDHGFKPFRYPSGENKSVDMASPHHVFLIDETGKTWVLFIKELPRA